jgi:hypothetical protein
MVLLIGSGTGGGFVDGFIQAKLANGAARHNLRRFAGVSEAQLSGSLGVPTPRGFRGMG